MSHRAELYTYDFDSWGAKRSATGCYVHVNDYLRDVRAEREPLRELARALGWTPPHEDEDQFWATPDGPIHDEDLGGVLVALITPLLNPAKGATDQ